MFPLVDSSMFEFMLIDNLKKIISKFCSVVISDQTILASIFLTFFHFPLITISLQIHFPLFLVSFLVYIWWYGVLLFFKIFLLPDGLKYLWFWDGSEITLVASGSSTFSEHPKPLEVTLCYQVLIRSCWASLLFELGPFGRIHLLYLLWPVFPVWTWPFWEGCLSLISEVVLQDGGISQMSLCTTGRLWLH